MRRPNEVVPTGEDEPSRVVQRLIQNVTEGLPIRVHTFLPDWPHEHCTYVDYAVDDRTLAVVLTPEAPLVFGSRASVDLEDNVPVVMTRDVLAEILPGINAAQADRVLLRLAKRLQKMHTSESPLLVPLLMALAPAGGQLLVAPLPGGDR